MSSPCQPDPAEATYTSILAQCSRIASSARLCRGSMEGHAFAGDARGKHRPNLAGRDQVDVAGEEHLGVGIQCRTLAQAEAATGGWLHEEVQVRIRPEVGPGGGAERHHATQAVATSEGMHAPVARGRDTVVEPAQKWSVVIAMSRPIRERAVDGPGEHAHPERAVAT